MPVFAWHRVSGAVGVAALGLALGLASGDAAGVPLPPAPATPALADPDEAAEALARAALLRLGLTHDSARARVAGLSAEERRALAAAAEELGVGGAHRVTLAVVIGLSVFLVILLLVL